MIDVIKKLSGNVVGIGLDDKLVKEIEKNNLITNCNLLDSYTKKEKKLKGIKGKTINIKKLRKVFKKKKVDYIICNYSVLEKYLITFVSDSVYINLKKIYFYNIKETDVLIKKYKRYNTIIKNTKEYLEIDNSNSKTNKFKDIYYTTIDFINRIIEIIGDILMG